MSDLIVPSRRRFLLGASAFLAAPAIIRVASIMSVSVVEVKGREYLHTLEPPGWLNLDSVIRLDDLPGSPIGMRAARAYEIVGGSPMFVPLTLRDLWEENLQMRAAQSNEGD